MNNGLFRGHRYAQGLAAILIALPLICAAGPARAATAVRISAPANHATVSGAVAINYYTVARVAWVDTYVDGQYLASSPSSWDSTAVANGRHRITVKGFLLDRRLVGASSVIVNVRNAAAAPTPAPAPAQPSPTPTPAPTPMPLQPSPTPAPSPAPQDGPLAITAPAANATVSGSVAIAIAMDATVSWANFYVDGAYQASTPPSAYVWDSTVLPDGPHTIEVKGFSAAGQLDGDQTVTVTVANAAATPTPTPTPAPTAAATPAPAFTGTAYYVDSSGGNDSNSGTSASQAWQTLNQVQNMIGSLQPGDSVLFARGRQWNGGLTLTGLNGAVGAAIIIGNYGSGALPIIDGGSSNQYGFYASSGSYFTIDGFEVRNETYGGVSLHSDGSAMPGIIVQNMNIHNTGPGAYAGGSGPYDDGGYRNQLELLDFNEHKDGVKFLNNTVHDGGGHNLIQVHGDTGGAVISGNDCYGPWNHNCIDVKGVIGAVISKNTVHDGSNGAAFYLENTAIPMADVTWANNVAYNVGNGFECEGGGTDSSQGVTCRAYNNTLYLGGASAIVTGSDCTQPVNWDVRNNILDTTDTLYEPSNCSNRSMVWDYNDDGGSQGSVGGPSGPHDMNGVNPDYVNAGGDDFHLQSGSPLINAGQTGLVSAMNDIGAY
jgi:hypothetical protein